MELEATTRNTILEAVADRVDGGTGTAHVRLETSGDAEVAAFPMQDPAFGAPSSFAISAAGLPLEDSDANGGTVAKLSQYDQDNTKLWEETDVGTDPGNAVTLSSLAIGAGETVTLTEYSITMPASAA